MAELFIRTRGTLYGPYSEAEFQSHLTSGGIPFSAWVHRNGGWSLLAEVEELRTLHPEYEARPVEAPSARAGASKTLAPRPLPTGGVSSEPVWFYALNRKRYGPYSAADLLGRLQRKELAATTFVWKPGFATWQKMSQVAEFSRETVKRLAAGGGEPLDILVKRKFVRAPYEVEIIAHDNTRAIEGRSMMIGEGGLFLSTPKPVHTVGTRLKVHFREGKAPAFNAVAEVVSVVYGDQPGYCMRFVALSDSDRRKITKLVGDKK